MKSPSLIFGFVYIRFSHFSHFLELEKGTIEEPISTLLGVGFDWSPHDEPFIDFLVGLHKDLTFSHISSHFPNSKLVPLNCPYQHYPG